MCVRIGGYVGGGRSVQQKKMNKEGSIMQYRQIALYIYYYIKTALIIIKNSAMCTYPHTTKIIERRGNTGD